MKMKCGFSVHGRRLLEDREIMESSAPIGPPVERLEGSKEVPYIVNSGYDLMLAIIITALFCSVLCALAVSSLLRFTLLCRRWRVVSEPSLGVVVRRAQTAIKEMDIQALPVTVCRMGSPFADMDCPICLAEFMDGEKVRVLPECCHSFHADCIDTWLLSNPSCPSCRHSLLYILSTKPSGIALPAAEPAESPESPGQMQANEGNESVEANHVVQSFPILVDGSTLAVSSSLDSIQSTDLETNDAVAETRRS